jgi:ArsR family transcriptional regulator
MQNSVTFAKALADDTRQKIMSLVCCCWMSVNEIAEQIDVSQPTVSHHLRVLRSAGLVETNRAGKQVFYTLNQARLAAHCCQLVDSFAPELQLEILPPLDL